MLSSHIPGPWLHHRSFSLRGKYLYWARLCVWGPRLAFSIYEILHVPQNCQNHMPKAGRWGIMPSPSLVKLQWLLPCPAYKMKQDFSALASVLLTGINPSFQPQLLRFVPLTYSSQVKLSSVLPEIPENMPPLSLYPHCSVIPFYLHMFKACLLLKSSDTISFVEHSLIVSMKIISHFFEPLWHFLCTSLKSIHHIWPWLMTIFFPRWYF